MPAKQSQSSLRQAWRSWYEFSVVGGLRSLQCALIGAKKEQSVWNNGAANCAAKLITFQAISRQRKRIARIEHLVPNKFKQAAVQFVCSGLGNRINGAGGMLP